MLQLRNIAFAYDDKPLLQNFNLSAHPGTFYSIMGESGSGKSTLLHIIAGRLQWQEGVITWHQKTLPGPKDQLIPEHDEIRLIAQDFELNLYYTVEENIRNVVLHWEEEEIQKALEYWLDRFQLASVRHQKTHTLSGGQKQRLAWIRSLIDLPDVVLLDEPTNQIDENFAFQFLAAIYDKVKSENKIAILVTHKSQEILQWSDQLLLMKKGAIIRQDEPSKVYNAPQDKYEAMLFGPVNIVDNQILRPHQIDLVKDAKGLFKVEKIAFLGAYYEVILTTNNGQQIIAHTRKWWEPGEKISFTAHQKNAKEAG